MARLAIGVDRAQKPIEARLKGGESVVYLGQAVSLVILIILVILLFRLV